MITAHIEWQRRDYSQLELLQEYIRVRKVLGNKTLTNLEINQHSLISFSWLIKKHRYWNNFLKGMGDVPHVQARTDRQRNYGRVSETESINH